ncbi:hypothetical protein NKR23_g11228 [Pleurostoma richardsiae]|uniref:ABM domain-containing protein n=1 Tax=Pleurostoma richardsiae TaxID=41990 RepID=A0AA38VDN4_9PEZI|nr:hypothetical protein NKR23_g11228 [Pleurostoma richardsiae]
MPTKQALQLILIPHRPAVAAEIENDLAPAFAILQRAKGLKALWRGKKFEDRYTQVALCLWEDLESSHSFFTSPSYAELHKLIQPAMNGRSINWTTHALLDHSRLSSYAQLASTLESPAIEVALTKVTEGGVAGYYSQFNKVVAGILDNEPGCNGYFISPLIEEPQDQLLLINWKSVDAHHEEFEKKPGFRACIDALMDYYRVFVVPWHITEIYKVKVL